MNVMRYIFFSVVLLVDLETGVAQKHNIDSLKVSLRGLKDSARIDLLNQIANAYVHIKIDSTEIFADKALNESKKIDYKHGIAEATSLQAEVALYKKSDYDLAETMARQAIHLYSYTTNKTRLNRTYHQLGHALYAKGQFAEAVKNFDTCFRLSEQIGDGEFVFGSVYISAYLYMDAGDYKNAFLKAQAMHGLVQKYHSRSREAALLMLIGDLYSSININDSALSFYRKAHQLAPDKTHFLLFAQLFTKNQNPDSAYYYLQLVDTAESVRKLQFYLAGMGEYYLFKNEYNTALPVIQRSLDYFERSGDRNQIIKAWLNMAKSKIGLKDYSSALRLAHTALSMARQIRSRLFLRDSYGMLYEIHQKFKNSDSTLAYYEQYVSMKDSINMAQVEAKLVAFNFDQKVKLLEKEKQFQQSTLERQSLLKNLLVAAIILAVLIGFLFSRTVMLKRKAERQRREIAENELQVQKLESEKTKAELQQQATELEMQALRAQMNPHFIFNSLNSINRFVLANDKLRASEYLTKFSRLVRLILQNSQASLIPLENELDALRLYLELEEVRSDHQFESKIVADPDLDIELIKVPPLIIQPYAENAIWHGLIPKEEKGTLLIELYEENRMLCCKVTDNGIGRKKARALKNNSGSPHRSMGMKITANRIAMIQQKKVVDAQIKITDLILPDGQEGGTEVLLKIPLINSAS